MENKKHPALLIWLIVFLAGVMAYFIYQNAQQLQEEIPNLVNNPAGDTVNGTGGGEILNENFNTNTNSQTNQTLPATQNLQAADFQLSYPADWQLKKSEESGIRSYNFSTAGQEIYLSVMEAGMAGIVEDSISIESETTIQIGGLAARQLNGADLKDGSPVVTIILIKGNLLYNFKAQKKTFLDQLISDFLFI